MSYHSIKQSLSWEASSHSPSEKISILWSLKFHYSDHKNLPLVQFQGPVLLGWGVVSPSSKPQTGGPPLIVCPWLLVQYTRTYSPCLPAVSIHKPPMPHAVLTGTHIITDPLKHLQLIISLVRMSLCFLSSLFSTMTTSPPHHHLYQDCARSSPTDNPLHPQHIPNHLPRSFLTSSFWFFYSYSSIISSASFFPILLVIIHLLFISLFTFCFFHPPVPQGFSPTHYLLHMSSPLQHSSHSPLITAPD